MPKPRVLMLLAPDLIHKPLFAGWKTEYSELELQIADRYDLPWKTAKGWDVACVEQYENHRESWRDRVKELRRNSPDTPVILLARTGSEDLAIESLRMRLADYLPSPWSQTQILEAVTRCLPRRQGPEHATEAAKSPPSASHRMIGTNPGIRSLRSFLTDVATGDATVLITGETGTGKELAAQFIHENSLRKRSPLVCINCAAIPDSLLESELFGHTKGAFTGADGLSDGLLAAADGGTVFLDEIGDMSLFAQAKILRVLENKEVHQLGGTRRVRLNLRFIAATNRDLEAMTACGSFRKDLYFRINVVPVQLPPLRERRDDIPLLLDRFCRELSCKSEAEVPAFSEECLRCLLQYDWPGNIRELKNVVEALFVGRVPTSFCPEHLPQKLRRLTDSDTCLPAAERDLLIKALCAERWNKSRAAAKLNWSRMTLYRKMAKYQISSTTAEVDEPAEAYREDIA